MVESYQCSIVFNQCPQELACEGCAAVLKEILVNQAWEFLGRDVES